MLNYLLSKKLIAGNTTRSALPSSCLLKAFLNLHNFDAQISSTVGRFYGYKKHLIILSTALLISCGGGGGGSSDSTSSGSGYGNTVNTAPILLTLIQISQFKKIKPQPSQ